MNRTAILLASLLLMTLPAISNSGSSHSLKSLDPLINENASAESGGQLVLLQFWASWCHSCSGIMFDMDELMESNPGFRYVAVSLDEQFQDAEQYIRKHSLFDKYSDSYFHDEGKRLADVLGVKTVPTIVLLDRNGDVLIKKSGHLNSQDKQALAREMKDAL